MPHDSHIHLLQSMPRVSEKRETVHTCQCTSLGARLQFKSWLAAIPSLIYHHGGKISQSTMEIQRATEKCITGDHFPCGQYLCGRMSGIQQVKDRVTVYAEIARRKENLVLLVGVREGFQFGHVTPTRMSPMEHVLCLYNRFRSDVLENVILNGKWSYDPIAASCFYFTMKSVQGNNIIPKLHYTHYNAAGSNSVVTTYSTNPI